MKLVPGFRKTFWFCLIFAIFGIFTTFQNCSSKNSASESSDLNSKDGNNIKKNNEGGNDNGYGGKLYVQVGTCATGNVVARIEAIGSGKATIYQVQRQNCQNLTAPTNLTASEVVVAANEKSLYIVSTLENFLKVLSTDSLSADGSTFISPTSRVLDCRANAGDQSLVISGNFAFLSSDTAPLNELVGTLHVKKVSSSIDDQDSVHNVEVTLNTATNTLLFNALPNSGDVTLARAELEITNQILLEVPNTAKFKFQRLIGIVPLAVSSNLDCVLH
jgi:hypothetical protein